MAIEYTHRKGRPGGYAGLGGDGKVPAGQLPAPAGGASGPVLMSSTPYAKVMGEGPPLPLGMELQNVYMLTNTQIQTGDDYWGVENSALDLAMTINEAGEAAYPADIDNAIFDIWTEVLILGIDPADSGKLVKFAVLGLNTQVETVAVVIASVGSPITFAAARMAWSDQLFVGDAGTGASLSVRVDQDFLTVPPIYPTRVLHLVSQRVS